MKKINSIFLILLSFVLYSQDLKPTETKALLNILVTDLEGFPRNGEIIIAYDITKNKEYTAKTNKAGKCGILVPKGRKYKIKYLDLIEKTNYSDFDVPNKFGLMSFNVHIKFSPSKIIEAKHIKFKKNTLSLTMSATNQLDTIAEILKSKKLKIEIASHTDNSLSKKEALHLTQKRAEIIKEYLIIKGVEKSKLTTKGYGLTEPIADNKTEESKQKNNRIELRIKQLYY